MLHKHHKICTRWHGSVGRAKQSYFATKENAKSLGFKASHSPGWAKFPGRTPWSVGSVGRAHRSHRWGHWFESSTDHSLPSSGGLFFAIFHFPACLPQKPPSGEKSPKPLSANLLRLTRALHEPTARQSRPVARFSHEPGLLPAFPARKSSPDMPLPPAINFLPGTFGTPNVLSRQRHHD